MPTTRESRYIRFLPGIYQRDRFLHRFLLIFESMWTPLEEMADQMHHYLEPMLTPPEMLSYLSYWIDLKMQPGWDLAVKRRLVKNAMELYRWRGTRRGLARYLEIITGLAPEIEEEFPGMRLGSETRLGVNSLLGGTRAYFFRVTFKVPPNREVDRAQIERIIESEKPAFAQYELVITEGKEGA